MNEDYLLHTLPLSVALGVLIACWMEIRMERYFSAQWKANAESALELATQAAKGHAKAASLLFQVTH